MAFEHLGLADWPFRAVPPAGPTSAWHDRSEVKQSVDRLIWRLGRQPQSTLHFLWADVGSGKSHTLRYMQSEAATEGSGMLPMYAVMPKTIRSFMQVYEPIARAIDLEVAGASLMRARQQLGEHQAQVLVEDWPDLVPALALYASGTPDQQSLVRRWFNGAREVTRAELRRVGIGRDIRSSDDAVSCLTAVSRVLLRENHRLVVLLDEVQRIGLVRSSIAADVCAGLHTWYNAVPLGLTLLLTFSFGDRTFLQSYVSPELLSREDHHRIEMPHLSADDAVVLVEGLLEQYGLPGATPTLNRGLIDEGVRLLGQQAPLTPRNVIKCFDTVLEEMDFRGASDGSSLSPRDLEQLLQQVNFDADWETE